MSLLILCISTTASAVGGLRKITSDETSMKKKLQVTDKVILFEHSSNKRRETQIVPVAFFGATNTIEVDGKTYSLDNLEEFSVLSPDIVVMSDDSELTSDNIQVASHWIGNDGTAKIFVAKDENGHINLIDIFDGENVTTLVANITTGEYEELSRDEGFNKTIVIDTDQENPDGIDLDFSLDNNIFVAQQGCGNLRTIQLAVAVTSSFCSWAGGQQAAVNKVQTIVAQASNKYRQQGVCLTLQLSGMDMRCNLSQDIYNNMATSKSGCFGSGLLQDFQNYWQKNNRAVPRDTAHLFTAKKFDGPVGCSTQATLCSGAGSYGVNYMTMYPSLNMQGVLLAHEIAHNCGATHLSGDHYIMNTWLTDGSYGFAPQSVQQISNYINNYGNCLR